MVGVFEYGECFHCNVLPEPVQKASTHTQHGSGEE